MNPEFNYVTQNTEFQIPSCQGCGSSGGELTAAGGGLLPQESLHNGNAQMSLPWWLSSQEDPIKEEGSSPCHTGKCCTFSELHGTFLECLPAVAESSVFERKMERYLGMGTSFTALKLTVFTLGVRK